MYQLSFLQAGSLFNPQHPLREPPRVAYLRHAKPIILKWGYRVFVPNGTCGEGNTWPGLIYFGNSDFSFRSSSVSFRQFFGRK
jgi:hypothetical protein